MAIILYLNVIPHYAILNYDAAPNYALFTNYRVQYLRVFSNSRLRSNHTVVTNSTFNMAFYVLAVVPIEWLNLSYSSVKDRQVHNKWQASSANYISCYSIVSSWINYLTEVELVRQYVCLNFVIGHFTQVQIANEFFL